MVVTITCKRFAHRHDVGKGSHGIRLVDRRCSPRHRGDRATLSGPYPARRGVDRSRVPRRPRRIFDLPASNIGAPAQLVQFLGLTSATTPTPERPGRAPAAIRRPLSTGGPPRPWPTKPFARNLD